jgi:hypothetical protein
MYTYLTPSGKTVKVYRTIEEFRNRKEIKIIPKEPKPWQHKKIRLFLQKVKI